MQASISKITQAAFITRDIQASMEHFATHLGIGPWFLNEPAVLADCRYRGAVSEVHLTTAFTNARGLEFELMQLDNDAPSMWRDALEKPFSRETFHHWCRWPEDYDAALSDALSAGYRVLQDGSSARGRFVYLEHLSHPDDILELTEQTTARRAFQHLVAEAGRDWDGQDPVRPNGSYRQSKMEISR